MAASEKFFPFIKDQEFELILGSSFDKKSGQGCAYHTIRYDFKPASVDSFKPAELVVGEKNDVMVTVPHVQDSGSTVYKGSKRPCPKEFILVIDKKTQTFTLERIESTVPQLKKIRSANPAVKGSKIQSSSTVTSETVKKGKKSKPKSPAEETSTTTASSSKEPSPLQAPTEPTEQERPSLFSSSDSSSSDSENDDQNSDDDDDDDDDDEVDDKHVELLNNFLSSSLDPGNLLSKKPEFNQLCEDLQLSESGSDSD